jgi:hypothetical protein
MELIEPECGVRACDAETFAANDELIPTTLIKTGHSELTVTNDQI